MLEFIKVKSDEENCPARKSRKREDKDDSRIKTAPHQTPKMSDKKRSNQRTLSAIHLSKEKPSIILYREYARVHPSVHRGCGFVMARQG